MVVRVLVVLAVLAGLYYFGAVDKVTGFVKKSPTPTPLVQTTKVTLEIISSPDTVKVYPDIEFSGTVSALDVTRTVTAVETKGEGEQTFVYKLNNKEINAAKKEKWDYMINGSKPQESPSDYIVRDGDVITWKVVSE